MELPNYYDALVKTRLAETAGVLTDEIKVELEAELRRVLRNKIQVAIENAVGYGLDSVETEASAAAMPTGDGWDQDQEDDLSAMSGGLAEIPMLGATSSGVGGGAVYRLRIKRSRVLTLFYRFFNVCLLRLRPRLSSSQSV